MTVFAGHTEGHRCATCGIHRTMTVQGRCPSCQDDAKRAEKAEREEQQEKPEAVA